MLCIYSVCVARSIAALSATGRHPFKGVADSSKATVLASLAGYEHSSDDDDDDDDDEAVKAGKAGKEDAEDEGRGENIYMCRVVSCKNSRAELRICTCKCIVM